MHANLYEAQALPATANRTCWRTASPLNGATTAAGQPPHFPQRSRARRGRVRLARVRESCQIC